MTNLSPHFSLDEFTRSETAARQGIANTPPQPVIANLIETARMLERIRDRLSWLAGRPVRIQITSGYRCLRLNRAIGSSDTSDHVRGLAADWIAPDFGTPLQIAEALAPLVGGLQIGQLIHEYGAWVHTGVPMPSKAINRVLTIGQAGAQPGIHPAWPRSNP